MVSFPPLIPNSAPLRLPLYNETVADRLDEIAELFEAKSSNPYRVRAYRNAANTIRSLDRQLAEIVESLGREGLTELPGIGESIARTVERLIATGELALLERLRGRSQGDAVLATVAGVGAKTAARIRAELGIDTLAELEIAAYDGRLASFPGIGRKRLRAVRESLAGRFQRNPRVPTTSAGHTVWQPDIAELLSIDEEYRRKAEAGRLLQVSPIRFNPSGKAWLPILRTRREGRSYTALYSNSPRAHQLGTTFDWVVIYREGSGGRGQWTVVTSRQGTTKGLRVIRGREAECDAHYARLAENDAPCRGDSQRA